MLGQTLLETEGSLLFNDAERVQLWDNVRANDWHMKRKSRRQSDQPIIIQRLLLSCGAQPPKHYGQDNPLQNSMLPNAVAAFKLIAGPITLGRLPGDGDGVTSSKSATAAISAFSTEHPSSLRNSRKSFEHTYGLKKHASFTCKLQTFIEAEKYVMAHKATKGAIDQAMGTLPSYLQIANYGVMEFLLLASSIAAHQLSDMYQLPHEKIRDFREEYILREIKFLCTKIAETQTNEEEMLQVVLKARYYIAANVIGQGLESRPKIQEWSFNRGWALDEIDEPTNNWAYDFAQTNNLTKKPNPVKHAGTIAAAAQSDEPGAPPAKTAEAEGKTPKPAMLPAAPPFTAPADGCEDGKVPAVDNYEKSAAAQSNQTGEPPAKPGSSTEVRGSATLATAEGEATGRQNTETESAADTYDHATAKRNNVILIAATLGLGLIGMAIQRLFTECYQQPDKKNNSDDPTHYKWFGFVRYEQAERTNAVSPES